MLSRRRPNSDVHPFTPPSFAPSLPLPPPARPAPRCSRPRLPALPARPAVVCRSTSLPPAVGTDGAPAFAAAADEPAAFLSADGDGDKRDGNEVDDRVVAKKRSQSEATKRKIAYSMLGQRKSSEMRAKVSAALKGRVPWNKGKKLSAETRARMSQARFGRMPWNKGRELSGEHRTAISTGAAGVQRDTSAATIKRMRMARRRPGDAIVSGGGPAQAANGQYGLVDSTDINLYVTLRRELRVWSDEFAGRNGRRPSLADVRRIGTPDVVGKFEQYTRMRERLRGLAADVYGSVNPDSVPVVSPQETASSPQNNNQGSVLHITANGNPRLIPKSDAPGARAGPRLPGDGLTTSESGGEGAAKSGSSRNPNGAWGKWDIYDSPTRGDYSSGFQVSENLLVDAPSEADATESGSGKSKMKRPRARKDSLSPNDYRAIGKYRLMESIDINRYVQLRRDLVAWSAKFKAEHDRTPTLSDVREAGDPTTYTRFCDYIERRGRMDGLVREVFGAELDDVEQIQQLSKTGRELVDQLRHKKSIEKPSHPIPPPTPLEQVERLKHRSPPSVQM